MLYLHETGNFNYRCEIAQLKTLIMKVLFFGIARDIANTGSMAIEKSQTSASTVGELRSYLQTKFPELKKLSSLAIAVNENYAEDNFTLSPNDEIALIPPVSGG